MPDNNSQSGNLIAIENTQIPVEQRLVALHNVLQNTDLPLIDKIRLFRQEMKALFEYRKVQLETALTVEKDRLKAGADLARRRIEASHLQLSAGIQKEVQAFIDAQIRNLEFEQATILRTFAEQIVQFENDLQYSVAKPQHKERILLRLERAFDELESKLDRFKSTNFSLLTSAVKPEPKP